MLHVCNEMCFCVMNFFDFGMTYFIFTDKSQPCLRRKFFSILYSIILLRKSVFVKQSTEFGSLSC